MEIGIKILQKLCIVKNMHSLPKYGDWHREISPLIHKQTRLFSRYL